MKPAESSGCPVEGANQTTDKFTLEDAHLPVGSEDGDNSLSQGNRNEPEPNTQLGEPGKTGQDAEREEDLPLNIDKIILRFDEMSRNRYRGTTPRYYRWQFRRFAKYAELEKYSRRQIAGPLGKRLILEFLSTLPKRSVKFANAGIKSVWKRGIGLPYPVEPDMDLDRPPKTMPRNVPPTKVIKEWAEALEHEKDPYHQLLWLLEVNYGWRPSHICKMKWRNVQWDESGIPLTFIGDGARESYKNNSVIVAAIYPEVMKALIEIRKMENYDPSPEKPILPFRYLKRGDFVSCQAIIDHRNSPTCRKHPYKIRTTPTEQDTQGLDSHWTYLMGKYSLPKLRMCDIRHWVSSTCKKAGIPKDVACRIMGHDPEAGKDMQDWYSCMTIEDIVDVQRIKLPNGPLGTLSVEISISSDIPAEVASLWLKYSTGQIGLNNLMNEIEMLKNRQTVKPPEMET